MTKQEVINSTKDAITASGKKFNEIPRESFYSFFEKEGIPKSMWQSVYDELAETYQPKKKKVEAVQGSISQETFVNGQVHKVDYYSNSHNDVKKREPRKSIFSEVVKIAG